jgi:UDP-4-amino-4,6-dideoxy-N-acetyl-beta-L-altrosamine transaminase
MIPYGRQEISEEDVDAVIKVLRSDFLTQGPMVPEFEKALGEHANVNHVIAVNSATSALHIACLALGLGPGDILWTSPITFVASANCGLYCGASVDFVDIDPDTYNMCPHQLEEKLIVAKARGKLPKVVIPVHLCGQPCDMRAINDLSKRYGFKVIEDASHAIGAYYLDRPIGNCEYSDITIYSFHPVKIITTGEGGAALTNDAELAKKMTLYRGHGITRDQDDMTDQSHGPWYYQQIELGYNYRMTDLQAALGVSQMGKLSKFVSERHKIARRYDSMLAKLPIKTPLQIKGSYSGLHLYVIRLNLSQLNVSHKVVVERLLTKGLGVNVHYIPVYMQPYYKLLGFVQGYCPEAERYYSEAISLPMYPTLSLEQQCQIVSLFKQAIS